MIFKTIAVGCEARDCYAEIEGLPGERLAEVRKQARMAGWTTGAGQSGRVGDYCPKHRSVGRRP